MYGSWNDWGLLADKILILSANKPQLERLGLIS